MRFLSICVLRSFFRCVSSMIALVKTIALKVSQVFMVSLSQDIPMAIVGRLCGLNQKYQKFVKRPPFNQKLTHGRTKFLQ